MKYVKFIVSFLGIAILLVAVVGFFKFNFTDSDIYIGHEDKLLVKTPLDGYEVSSPLEVKGMARGFWFFEATAPIQLLDEDGFVVVESYIQAEGEWMTEGYVPFAGTITFDSSTLQGTPGTLVLKNHNASGLPEHEDSFEISIIFK